MHNIYNDSSFTNSQNLTPESIVTSDITTSGLTINGSTKGQILIIDDTNGSVDGLDLGSNNDVLVANPTNNGLPGYTNSLNINTLTCNDLKINGVQTGDLLVGVTNNFIDKLPIGISGNLLTSDGTNPVWAPITFPNPLTLQNIVLTSSLQLTYPGYGILILDNSNIVTTDRNNFKLDSSVINFPNSPLILSTFNYTIKNGFSYNINCNFNCSASPNTATLVMNLHIGSARSWTTNLNNSSQYTSYSFTSNTSGTFTANITGTMNTANGSANNFVWNLIALGRV